MMCDVRDRHDYSEDARIEMGEEPRGFHVNGWVGEFINSILKVWPIILVVGVWVIRVEMRIGPGGFTGSDAVEMERRIDQKIDELPPPLYRTQMDNRFEDLTNRLDRIETNQTLHINLHLKKGE